MNTSMFRPLFSQTEWQTLQFTVLWLIRSVARADGRIDSHEYKAMETLQKLAQNFKNDLAREVMVSLASHLTTINNKFTLTFEDMKGKIDEIVDILEKKFNPRMALDFKKNILAIALFVANASGYSPDTNSRIGTEEADMISEIIHKLKMSQDDLNRPPSLDSMVKNFRVMLKS